LNHMFCLNGISHDRGSLRSLCLREMVQQDPGSWKWELFSFMNSWIDTEVVEFEQYTSGTTGPPRKYMLIRSAMMQSATNTLAHFSLGPGSRALLCLPVRYVAGKMMVVRAMIGGLDMVTAEPSSRPLRGVEGSFDFAAMVPLQVHESLHQGDDLTLIRDLLIGGGEIHPQLREQLKEMERPAFHESFAMTETYTHFALHRINGSGTGPYFRPMTGVQLNLDHRGCLVVEVPGVTDGPVITNDLVEMAPDGTGFRWLGRVDHLISTGGIKVIPEAVEEKIRPLIGAECLVLPERDVRLGMRLVLMVEWDSPDPPVEEWFRILRKKLPFQELPKRIIPVRSIPRNSSYKPDRLEAIRLVGNI